MRVKVNGARSHVKFSKQILMFAATLSVSSTAFAVNTDLWLNASGGNWSTVSNWSNNATPGDLALFNLSSASAYTVNLTGTSGTGALEVGTDIVNLNMGANQLNTNSTLIASGDLLVGDQSGQNGSLNMSGTGLYNGDLGWIIGANGGSGALTVGVKSTVPNGGFNVGSGTGSVGTLTLNNSVQGSGHAAYIGQNGGTGTLTIGTAGSFTTPDNLFIGSGAGSTGKMNLVTGGSFKSTLANLSIGDSGGAGTLNASGGSIACGTFSVGDGLPSGQPITTGGTATVNLSNGATVSATSLLVGAAGTLRVLSGSTISATGMTLTSGDDLDFGLDGASASQNGAIHLSGPIPSIPAVANFAGELDVTLENGFSPTAGESFDLVIFTSSTGSFSSVNLPSLGSGLAWNTSQLYSTGTISVVPEPVSSGSLLMGAAALLRRRPKHR